MAFKVLLVDDEFDFRDLIALFLRREGYETECASDGREAFEKIQNSRPDLIVTDIRMPGWDGYELLRHVGTLEPPVIPMLFLSGFGRGNDEAQLKSSPNYVGFVTKPIRLPNLLELIKEIQAQKSFPPKNSPNAHVKSITT
jgi:CheY-like chemotaxis protein